MALVSSLYNLSCGIGKEAKITSRITYFCPKTSNFNKIGFSQPVFYFLQECVLEGVYFGAHMVPSVEHFLKVVSGSQMACYNTAQKLKMKLLQRPIRETCNSRNSIDLK